MEEFGISGSYFLEVQQRVTDWFRVKVRPNDREGGLESVGISCTHFPGMMIDFPAVLICSRV